MFEHIVLFSSSYRLGKRIGWHCSKEEFSRKELQGIIDKTMEIIGETKYAVHKLTTQEKTWDSVVRKDSFFADIYIYDDLEEFLKEMKKDEKITALDVSKFLLTLQPMSNLKLQKMIYLVYADYLVKNNKKLFKEEIVAYQYGPVVENVYQIYKKYGKNEINLKEITFPMVYARFLQAEDAKNIIETIQKISKQYEEYSASELVNITHRKGSPWENTKINDVIKDEDIKKYHHIETN